MHILMIAPEQFPLPGIGSVEICILSIAKQLIKNHQVTILCRRHPKHGVITQQGNLKIVRLPSGGPNRYISSVLRYIKGKKFDFIQIDNRPRYMARVKEAKPNTPVSLFLHSLTFVRKSPKVAAQLKKADVIIANSTSVRNHLNQRFPGNKDKIKMVYLGVDTERFKPPIPKERNRSRKKFNVGNSFVTLFAGRIIPRKGIPVLLKASSIARQKIINIKLIIAGGGKPAYVRKLKSLAKQLGVPTKFVGNVPHHRIHHLYRVGDCFVCPSQQHEAFGLVNIEAMSTGLPVIASRVGGIKEIIKHGKDGYLVNSYRNPASFASYIITISTNREKAREISWEGSRTVLQRFNWNQTAKKLVKLYKVF
ncbi:glycosyltransferase family 1 protein [Paenibacillus albiflavus]|uniref:Glycosyltransferase family 1 protein n=1 Tax=Paenibacillus albiflavus TaxID=2545760 RepID=A0A4R4EQR3_9BACL|nr:glycosyltransferase family 4 protein [Paenibacillus albiflavus]TCZ80961.1 glycosyltransferase family 1 protein [Paenibacillus albiflavus]